MRDSRRGKRRERERKERTCPSTVRSISRSSNSHCSLLPICFYFQELQRTMALVGPSGARKNQNIDGESLKRKLARDPRGSVRLDCAYQHNNSLAFFCVIEESRSNIQSSVKFRFYLPMLGVGSEYENSCVWNVRWILYIISPYGWF